MPYLDEARFLRTGPPRLPHPRWNLAAIATALVLGMALSACDSKGKPLEAETPAADPNLLPATASSEHFAVERDREQVASSSAFVLIREEARHARN